MVTVAVALPPVLVAVMVYVVEVEVVVGVPLMAPVEVSNDKPAGRDGEIDQETTAPPLDVGVTAAMAEPLASVKEFGVYVMEVGAMSFTASETTVELLPPALVAVMV